MWNKRNEENLPATPMPEPARPNPAPRPAAVTPTPPPSRAIIGSSMKIKGDIRSQEELYIDGEVDGTLELRHSLTIGPKGKVNANIKARDVTIFGSVRGNVEVNEKIAIRENGSLIGDIKTAGISIDDGAYFKGSIDITRGEPPKAAVNGAAKAVAEPVMTSSGA